MEFVLGINNEINLILIFFVLFILWFVLVYVVFDEKFFIENSENKDFGYLVDKVRDLNFNWKFNVLVLYRSCL